MPVDSYGIDLDMDDHVGVLKPIWLQFLKTVFCYKNKENRNTKFKEQQVISKNTKMTFSVFEKTVLNNSFKKQEPNWPLGYKVGVLLTTY